jgi:hypothetical protein
MNVGRIIGVAVLSMLFMLFVALDLVLVGVLASNSAMVTVLPLLGVVAGAAAAVVAGKRKVAV